MKSLKEMFEYAKNIADTCENSYILFLVPTMQYLSALSEYTINKRTSTYQGKGAIKFAHIPNNMNETRRNFTAMRITHLFYITDTLPADVYCFLKSRVYTNELLKEPIGVYNEWWVERWEDYSLSDGKNY